jgi:hypothetical protein
MSSIGTTSGGRGMGAARPTITAIVALMFLGLAWALVAGAVGRSVAAASAAAGPGTALSGVALSGRTPLADVSITLYATRGEGGPTVLGRALTGRDGTFTVAYRRQLQPGEVA